MSIIALLIIDGTLREKHDRGIGIIVWSKMVVSNVIDSFMTYVYKKANDKLNECSNKKTVN